MEKRDQDSARDDLADISVAVVRLEERIRAMHDALNRHMSEEHRDFNESLKKVESLDEVVRDMRAAAKVTRWIAAVVSAFFAMLVWVKDHLTWK